MPWFLFEYRHGPGHQGNTKEYVWFPDTNTRTKAFKEYLDEMAHSIANQRGIEDWFCDPKRVKELPAEIHKEKCDLYWGQRKIAETMLEVLGVFSRGARPQKKPDTHWRSENRVSLPDSAEVPQPQCGRPPLDVKGRWHTTENVEWVTCPDCLAFLRNEGLL